MNLTLRKAIYLARARGWHQGHRERLLERARAAGVAAGRGSADLSERCYCGRKLDGEG